MNNIYKEPLGLCVTELNKFVNLQHKMCPTRKNPRYQNFENVLHLYAQNNISPLAASLVNMRTHVYMTTIL